MDPVIGREDEIKRTIQSAYSRLGHGRAEFWSTYKHPD